MAQSTYRRTSSLLSPRPGARPAAAAASLAALLALVPACATAPQAPAAPTPSVALPSAAALEAWLEPVFDRGYVHGMALGLIDETGSVVHGYGSLGNTSSPPNGDTIFQIGSLTKSFTGLWLATEIEAGQLQADAPVKTLLPSSVTVPTFDGTPITLQELASHTASLPDAPTNMHPQDPLNPWADYTVQDLYDFLATYPLPYAPGTEWVYSDTGMGLLGLSLSLRAGGTYGENIAKVVAEPLGLVDTTAVLSASQQERFAPGFDGDLNPIEAWTPTEATAGAGELKSTVNDLLEYAAAQAGITSSPLSAAMKRSQEPVHATTEPGYSYGYGWLVATGGPNLVWHNGAVDGAMSFLGFDPVTHKAVVILVDTNASSSMSSLGMDIVSSIGVLLVQWLDGTPPAPLASILPATVSLTPAELAPAVGTYTVEGGTLTVTLAVEGDELVASVPAVWPRPLVLYPTSPTSFVCREILMTGTFEAGAGGQIAGIAMDFGGQMVTATKE